jgi:TolB-like protein
MTTPAFTLLLSLALAPADTPTAAPMTTTSPPTTGLKVDSDAGEHGIGVAVLNVQTSSDVAAELSRAVSGLVATRLERARVFRIVSEDDVKQMVSFDQMKTALSCDEQASCLAEVGAALGVPYMLTGTLSKLGSSFVLNLTLLEIEKARVVARESARFPSIDALLDGLDTEVDRTMAPVQFALRGQLQLTCNEEGATISVDGVALGTTPVVALEIPSGPRRITVEKTGFVQFAVDVAVAPDAPVEVDVKLLPSPEFIRAHHDKHGPTRALALASTVTAGVLGATGAALLVGSNLWVESERADAGVAGDAALVADEQTVATVLGLYWGGWSAVGGSAVAAGLAAWSWLTGDDPDLDGPVPDADVDVARSAP